VGVGSTALDRSQTSPSDEHGSDAPRCSQCIRWGLRLRSRWCS
jgi:hypothetical protein